MRSLRRPAAAFIALALAGGLAACGDDGDSDTDASSATTVASTAPPTGADAIDIEMKDFSYTVSENLKAGGTIRLSNTGKEIHMIALGKLKEGKTLADLTAILQAPPEEEGPTTTAAATTGPTTTAATGSESEEGQDPTAEILDDVGAPGGLMGPGQKAEITVPGLAAGTYAMVCYIPVEGGGPPHFVQGMVGQFTVVGDKAAEPMADATFTVAPGKPVTGPATLTAGKKVLKFEVAAAADGEQLEPVLVKLDAGTTIADVNRAFAVFETETGFVLPVNAAAQVPGQVVAAVFDFGPARTVYIGVDLTAGTYGIDAHDSDPDDAPVDPVEQATFTVT